MPLRTHFRSTILFCTPSAVSQWPNISIRTFTVVSNIRFLGLFDYVFTKLSAIEGTGNVLSDYPNQSDRETILGYHVAEATHARDARLIGRCISLFIRSANTDGYQVQELSSTAQVSTLGLCRD